MHQKTTMMDRKGQAQTTSPAGSGGEVRTGFWLAVFNTNNQENHRTLNHKCTSKNQNKKMAVRPEL